MPRNTSDTMPVVKKEDGVYSVEMAPGARISWTFQPGREGTIATVRIHAPSLTRYGRVDENDDKIEFPIWYMQ
jgi:hypothetical protein